MSLLPEAVGELGYGPCAWVRVARVHGPTHPYCEDVGTSSYSPTGAAVTRGCAVPVGPPSDGQGECEQSVRARCGLWRGGRGVVVRGIVLGGVFGAGRGVGRWRGAGYAPSKTRRRESAHALRGHRMTG